MCGILGGAAWCSLLGDLSDHLKVGVWELLEDPRAELALRSFVLSACSILAPFFFRIPGVFSRFRGEEVVIEESVESVEAGPEDSEPSFDTIESVGLSEGSEETDRVSLSEWYREDSLLPELFSISDDPDEGDSVAGGPAGLV